MRKKDTLKVCLLSLILAGAAAGEAMAAPGPDQPVWRERPQPAQKSKESRDAYRLDYRHHHNRFYPSHGIVVDRLPRDRIVVPHRQDKYYFDAGIWYRPSGARFVVTVPPIGLSIAVLPPFYTTLWVGGLPYYYADGVYYNWRPQERRYVVVEAPRANDIVSLPPEPEQLFIYPKAGQSDQQQATDRYECHRWAADQSGFDPTQPGHAGIPEAEYAEKNADYQRATKACLEARDYSVR